nr:Lrp/AsnC family transcriptional regulator [Planosporangium thailandense]
MDEADFALLDELRRDGRASYEKLGTNVGLSRTAARARTQKLIESGTVRIEAIAHPAVEGYATIAHVSVVTDGVSTRDIAKRIAGYDNAPFVSIVAGRCTLIAELRTRDVEELDHAVSEVRDLPGVVSLDTVLYTDVVKDSHLPLGRLSSFKPIDLDDVDRQLLALLQTDGRMPYADLADHVGLSRAATRARVLRLLDEGVVVVKGLTDPTAMGITQMCGFQVNLGPGGGQAAAAIAKLPTVDFLARTLGRCDLIGTMIARSRSEVSTTLDAIRMLDGVRAMEAWWHLELVKERYSPQLRRD